MRGTPKQSRAGWREWWPLAVAACFLLAFFVFLRALPHEQLPATGLPPPSTFPSVHHPHASSSSFIFSLSLSVSFRDCGRVGHRTPPTTQWTTKSMGRRPASGVGGALPGGPGHAALRHFLPSHRGRVRAPPPPLPRLRERHHDPPRVRRPFVLCWPWPCGGVDKATYLCVECRRTTFTTWPSRRGRWLSDC
jgi:hypothetical protein